mgnify:CR=1 FL=1
MGTRFRVSADGFMDVRDTRKVRTPGKFERTVEATPEAHALAFLLSHSFPGHRRVVRRLRETDRKLIQLALWAEEVSERMTLVDRVWRRVTEPVPPPGDPEHPVLLQVVSYGDVWAYPLHLDGRVTRVIPHGGLSMSELRSELRVNGSPRMDLKSA